MSQFEPFHLVNRIEKQDYIMYLASNKLQKNVFASGLASGLIDLFDINSSANSATLAHKGILSNLQFDNSNSNLIWSSNKTGALLLWDCRTLTPVRQFNSPQNPIYSFDQSSCGNILAVGTELVKEESPLYFWDIRSSNETPLAVFEECHSDDITQVKFHPTKPNLLMTGSTDGLVCLYNLETLVEDDALYQVIKDDSIQKIGYFGPNYEYLYSLTHIETVSLWTFEDSEKIASFGDVRGVSPELRLDYCIDLQFDSQSNHLYLIAGSQT
jgi:WD40 repeat protein